MKQAPLHSPSQNIQSGPFDVVALVASAGGHAAIHTTLQSLPADFSVPIIVMMHLGSESTSSVKVISRSLPFTVEWVQPDSTLASGKVLVCPPKSIVELLPDGTFVITASEHGALTDKPMDRLLESVARCFGERAIGVILTGMGNDAALGARQLYLAGGTVVVQSESTAEYPDMSRAAIKAGAAGLVVPLKDVGQVIGEIVAGTRRPQPRSEREAIHQVFGEKGKIADRARQMDWSSHPLGPVHGWPAQLRELVRLVIEKPIPAQLLWSDQQFMFFNEAAIPTLGDRWAAVYGSSYLDGFPEMREDAQLHMRVLSGEPVQVWERHFIYQRNGRQDSWFDGVYTPIHTSDGIVVGIYTSWFERTREVLAVRRLKTLNQLAAAQVTTNRREALEQALSMLQKNADISFAVAYLLDALTTQALLVAAIGVEEGGVLAPRQLWMQSASVAWPLFQAVNEGKPKIVADLAVRFRDHLSTQEQVTPDSAVIYPLRDEAEGRVIGVLVLGTNPRLVLDEHYHEFLTLLAETIASKVAEAHAHQRERERLEQFAELDRTKTEFFANVSHEFRTPLTLLLAPLEDLLYRRDELPASLVDEVEVAANNSRRLLRLVNSLLDFSQIDSRRQQANIRPTDLCALTTDIASAFRSSIEAAGLTFRVECDLNLPPVPIDRDMWEKIVSNLLSNAFKFTFEGEIAVELHTLSLHAELVVKDTGIGIPQQEMPNLFKRFHRVRGARARTAEGSGIGLSIVDDLVKRLGGQLRARSTENVGTEFTIWIPYKSTRTQSAPGAAANLPERHEFEGDLAKEASRWLADVNTTTETPVDVMEDLLDSLPSDGNGAQGRILVVDDNADMRNYLQRLLSPHWNVELAPNGDTALKTAAQIHPDLILADVMMPGLDGFALIQRLRENAQFKHTPVVLLTARAGEEAAIQGLLAGANDYIGKPFSPRELMARLQAVVERARGEQALRESEEKYRTLFDSIDEGFCIIEVLFDEKDKPVDYRFLEINSAFENQTGILNGVDRRMREIQPHHEEHWFEIYGKVALTGEPVRFENPAAQLGRFYDVYAFRMGAPEEHRVAILFNDITERKRREANLAFLADISQDLAQLTKVDETTAALSRKIGEFFKVSRVNFAIINEVADEAVIIHEWHVEGLKDTSGERAYRLSTFISEEFYQSARAGEVLVVRDTRTDSRTTDAAYAEIDTRSFVTAPFVRNGEWQFLISIAETVPRDWQAYEIELLLEITNRIWWRLERARAEEALRESEERLRKLVEATEDGSV